MNGFVSRQDRCQEATTIFTRISSVCWSFGAGRDDFAYRDELTRILQGLLRGDRVPTRPYEQNRKVPTMETEWVTSRVSIYIDANAIQHRYWNGTHHH